MSNIYSFRLFHTIKIFISSPNVCEFILCKTTCNRRSFKFVCAKCIVNCIFFFSLSFHFRQMWKYYCFWTLDGISNCVNINGLLWRLVFMYSLFTKRQIMRKFSLLSVQQIQRKKQGERERRTVTVNETHEPFMLSLLGMEIERVMMATNLKILQHHQIWW